MAQKLYTREQMIEAFNYGQNPKGFDWIGDMIDSLTPIELPSDEEIDKKSFERLTLAQISGFRLGAKYVIDKILNK